MKLTVCILLFQGVLGWTSVARHKSLLQAKNNPPYTPCSYLSSDTSLAMGLMDSLSNFLNKREGDFVKLEDSGMAFGPGPLVLVYGIPAGIDDNEIQDMITDGAPTAAKKKAKVIRLTENDSNVLDLSLQSALDGLTEESLEATQSSETPVFAVPVLFFSGFENNEMMAVYNILGREIYEETSGQASAACAKAVPNAMEKPLRQVLDEISGDHRDAMALDSEQEA